MAGESISRILSPRVRCCRDSHPRNFGCERSDHSSRSRIAPRLEQPTRGSRPATLIDDERNRRTGRAGPPLLFGLAPRGVFHAPDVAVRAVGSYPTFSPLPDARDRKRRALGITSGLPQRSLLTGGLFSVALSVTGQRRRACVRLVAQSPGVTRRVALRSPDFPPVDPSPA
jgi:hypothetical protein